MRQMAAIRRMEQLLQSQTEIGPESRDLFSTLSHF